MSKKCPKCLGIFDDNHGFCCNCGCRLVDDIESDGLLTLGDANAISGGVNINRSKNITSHDTHYHSTIVHERSRSESELKLDAINQLRSKAEEIVAERGRIDSIAMAQLRPFALKLGIDEESFKSIIKDVRANRNGCTSGLSSANARYLEQAKQAIQTNDFDTLSNLFPRIEAMATISMEEDVQYIYNQGLSILNPDKLITLHERSTDENYWRSFWTIISYIKIEKYTEAAKVLALFETERFDKPESDQNLLEAYFNFIKNDAEEAKEFLNEIVDNTSEQLKPFLHALETYIYKEENKSPEIAFYREHIFAESIKELSPKEVTEIAQTPKIAINKVWVDQADGKYLRINISWATYNIKDETIKLKAHISAKTGRKLDCEYFYHDQTYKLINDDHKFMTRLSIDVKDLYIGHTDKKDYEFRIVLETGEEGFEDCIYISNKMTFTIRYWFNFLLPSKIDIIKQNCLP